MKKREFFVKFGGLAAISLAMGLVVIGCATAPELSSSTKYSEVIDAPKMSSADLFTKVNMWMVDAFNNPESVIQYSDKEAGVLKGKYAFTVPVTSMGMTVGRWVYFSTLTIETKDGKVRVSFSDPIYDTYANNGQKQGSGTLIRSQKQADDVIAQWKKLADSLKKALGAKGADW